MPYNKTLEEGLKEAEEFIHRAIQLPENGEVKTKEMFKLIDEQSSFLITFAKKIQEGVGERFTCDHSGHCACGGGYISPDGGAGGKTGRHAMAREIG